MAHTGEGGDAARKDVFSVLQYVVAALAFVILFLLTDLLTKSPIAAVLFVVLLYLVWRYRTRAKKLEKLLAQRDATPSGKPDTAPS